MWAKSNQYSIKLNNSFIRATKLIEVFPNIGRPTDRKNIRIVVVGHYLLIYEIFEIHILIIALWGSKQDPEGLKRFLE